MISNLQQELNFLSDSPICIAATACDIHTRQKQNILSGIKFKSASLGLFFVIL